MRHLVRHFLARMFDGEWSSARGQWTTVAVSLAAMALPAGMLMLREGSPMPEYAGKYRILSKLGTPDAYRAAVMADELALLVVLAAVTGLAALLVWQSLFPGRRDYYALAGLPIRSREIFGARFLAVAIFAGGLTVALNLLPALVAPFEFGGRWQINQSWWVNVAAQAGASGLECLFVFFAIVAIQGVLLNLLPSRMFVRVSAYVQGAVFCGFVFAALRSWSIKDWNADMVARLPEFASWAPPVWFAGLHEHLLGDRAAFFTAMADRALIACGAVVALSIVTYCLAYRRYRRILIESVETVPANGWRSWSCLDLLSRDPRQRAILHFMSATLSRSRSHRTIWLAYIGFALAIVFNSSIVDGALLVQRRQPWTDAVQFLVLFWPLACSAILLPGIKHVVRIPVEMPANWIFRMCEPLGRAQWMSAVERFVVAYAIAPIYVLLAPVAVYSMGWAIALRMTALQVLASLLMFEILFYSWQQLPFTCTYLPGKRALVTVLAAYLAVLGAVVPVISVMIAAAARFFPLFLVYGGGFLGGWLKIRSMRREGWGEAPILYEDRGDEVPDLGIRDISPRIPFSVTR